LASGRHGYHLEIATANAILAEDILTLLEECGFPAKLNERRKDFAVYLSDAENILDFLALTGAHISRLSLENMRIFRSLRGEVNRVVNAEAANLRKAATASVRQVADIRRIDKTIGLAALPTALKALAILRLKHPDASTSELGDMLIPPASKIAVYHRFRRIRALAESRHN
jgi:DNA-binding protein WhiA